MKSFNILFVGEIKLGARTMQRVGALKSLGHNVTVVSTASSNSKYEDQPTIWERVRYRLRRPVDRVGVNQKILELVFKQSFDVAWMDRAIEIKPNTLMTLRTLLPLVKLVWYAEDDMMNPIHRSHYVDASIPLFDLWVTTKSFNADSGELPSLGVKRVLFVNNSYDPLIHRNLNLPNDGLQEFKGDVSFVGTFEKPRSESLLYLANNGISVRVWGNGWKKLLNVHPHLKVENYPVYDDDYAMVICASKINLCFLRKGNRDLQTCRSIEIPAVGGFMIHERNTEICTLLREGIDAVFFSNDDELLESVRYWLRVENENDRLKIARQGHERIIAGKYQHRDCIQIILNEAMKEVGNASPG